jgi:hypothetical protein
MPQKIVQSGSLSLGPVDVQLFFEVLHPLGIGELFHLVVEVLFADADLDIVFLDDDIGPVITVVTFHTTWFDSIAI